MKVLLDFIHAKNAYASAFENGVIEKLSDDAHNDIFSILDLEEPVDQVPHTAILLDDAINILKESKFNGLINILFQNRQPRLMILICIQDMYGIVPQLKRNCDTIFLFAGMTDRHMFGVMIA
jgi:hypothetical protein